MTRDFDIVSLSETDNPDLGDTAPDFTRPLVNKEFWEDAALSTLTDEKATLLAFHPMDWSPTSINLWNELENRAWDDHHDVTIVGLSISTPYDHKRFLNQRDLDYGLFSDPTNTIAEKYDVVHNNDGMRGIAEPRPAAFLIDSDRTIRYAWVTDEWPAYPNYDEIEDAIREL